MSSRFVETAVVGVDAGGTRTRAICITCDGTYVGSGTSGPANHSSGSLAGAKDSIERAITEALSAPPKAGGPHILAVHIGSSGLEGPGNETEARRLIDGAVDAESVSIDTDAYAAWAGAFGCAPGIVLIAGTGSISLGVNERGQRGRAGGWGWRVGDEGSAYRIAIEGIRAALQTADRRRKDLALWVALREFVGIENVAGNWTLRDDGEQVRAWLTGKRRTTSQLAAFAPMVERAALQGCQVSRDILMQAGVDLAALVKGVLSQIGFAEPLSVALAGGVLRHNTVVRESLLRNIEQIAPGAAIIGPAYPPEVGAAFIAMSQNGYPTTPRFFQRLDAELASYPHKVTSPGFVSVRDRGG